MKKTSNDKAMSMRMAYGIILLLFVVGVVMVAVPISALHDMLTQIDSQSEMVVFEKGAFYLFGGGLLLILLFIWVTYALITNKPLPKKLEKMGFTVLGVCLALIFIVPITLHMAVEQNMIDKGYVICEAKSTQWLHVRTIVYTKTLPCD